MDTLIDFALKSLPSSLGMAIVLAIVAWCCRGFFDKVKQSIKKTDRNEDALKDIDKRLFSIDCAIKTMVALLGGKFKPVGEILAEKHSPRKLNNYGNLIYNEINGKTFLDTNKDELYKRIGEYNPKSPLDVESAANFACLSLSEEDVFKPMKNYIYNREYLVMKNADGTDRNYEVTLQDVCFVLSIPLRDMYLSDHPELTE